MLFYPEHDFQSHSLFFIFCLIDLKSSHTSNELICYRFSDKAIGDACMNDFDGDGVSDTVDSCPSISSIQRTSFEDHFLVDLSPTSSSEPQPKWRVTNKVCRFVFTAYARANST